MNKLERAIQVVAIRPLAWNTLTDKQARAFRELISMWTPALEKAGRISSPAFEELLGEVADHLLEYESNCIKLAKRRVRKTYGTIQTRGSASN